ncbi:hypothetical protein ACLKA6_010223 [Drosophila palustris]
MSDSEDGILDVVVEEGGMEHKYDMAKLKMLRDSARFIRNVEKTYLYLSASTAKIAMKANAAKAILDEPTAATEAYKKSVAQGIYCIHGARLWRMKHQAVVSLAA